MNYKNSNTDVPLATTTPFSSTNARLEEEKDSVLYQSDDESDMQRKATGHAPEEVIDDLTEEVQSFGIHASDQLKELNLASDLRSNQLHSEPASDE